MPDQAKQPISLTDILAHLKSMSKEEYTTLNQKYQETIYKMKAKQDNPPEEFFDYFEDHKASDLIEMLWNRMSEDERAEILKEVSERDDDDGDDDDDGPNTYPYKKCEDCGERSSCGSYHLVDGKKVWYCEDCSQEEPHTCKTCSETLTDQQFRDGKMCCDKPLFHDDEDEDEWFDRKYPNASCHRCDEKLNSKTVVFCGGGGGACETWYCSDCHEDGTEDCDVCQKA